MQYKDKESMILDNRFIPCQLIERHTSSIYLIRTGRSLLVCHSKFQVSSNRSVEELNGQMCHGEKLILFNREKLEELTSKVSQEVMVERRCFASTSLAYTARSTMTSSQAKLTVPEIALDLV